MRGKGLLELLWSFCCTSRWQATRCHAWKDAAFDVAVDRSWHWRLIAVCQRMISRSLRLTQIAVSLFISPVSWLAVTIAGLLLLPSIILANASRPVSESSVTGRSVSSITVLQFSLLVNSLPPFRPTNFAPWPAKNRLNWPHKI